MNDVRTCTAKNVKINPVQVPLGFIGAFRQRASPIRPGIFCVVLNAGVVLEGRLFMVAHAHVKWFGFLCRATARRGPSRVQPCSVHSAPEGSTLDGCQWVIGGDRRDDVENIPMKMMT